MKSSLTLWLSLSVGLACATTEPAHSPPPPAEDSARTGEDSQALRAAAEQGCVSSIAESNAQSYAKRAIANGVDEVSAMAEGQEAMRLASDLLQKLCACHFDLILDGQPMTVEHTKDNWMAAQLVSRKDDPRVQGCTTTFMEAFKAREPEMKKGLDAFRAKQGG
jgi:hypothetical protein